MVKAKFEKLVGVFGAIEKITIIAAVALTLVTIFSDN